ncbi:hypothetical protein, unlikely [Trypanosoma brucei brucei TREU927]|uniref:Uncharacterized protein n=1 Tax=Trypanosoma brucei brucei (strain 927/4 GUTat10.1) TaxID=185431 RepID=Q38CY3_TRYB2|nr:hypothetical protein, unlikely [Trypanosoma brucei brucei TREU927]EAN77337.1 hypothetical protein, unlikely [Trypanosoma brucei brucei TREU927]
MHMHIAPMCSDKQTCSEPPFHPSHRLFQLIMYGPLYHIPHKRYGKPAQQSSSWLQHTTKMVQRETHTHILARSYVAVDMSPVTSVLHPSSPVHPLSSSPSHPFLCGLHTPLYRERTNKFIKT